MNILYYTTDNTKVIALAKQYAQQHDKEFLFLPFDALEIERVYNYTNELVLCVTGINKSPKMDILLKLLENNTTQIDLFAVSNSYDVKPAIEARFNEIKFIKNDLSNTTDHNTIQYYINLANEIVDRHDNNMQEDLAKVTEIVDKYMLTTNNICWDSLYEELSC